MSFCNEETDLYHLNPIPQSNHYSPPSALITSKMAADVRMIGMWQKELASFLRRWSTAKLPWTFYCIGFGPQAFKKLET